MVIIILHCPRCGSEALVRDGHAPNGKQKDRCHACSRRSRENPTPNVYPEVRREEILESVRYYRTIFDWDFVIDEKDHDRGMKVWVPLAVEKPIPFKQAVDMSFVKKAQAKLK